MGRGFWGQRDLAGSVAEWNLDMFDAYADPCVDCADVTDSSTRVIRGGAFAGPIDGLRSVARNATDPAFRASDIGLRCARSP